MTDFLSSVLRFVLKLILGLMAAVFAVSLLAAALVVLSFGLLRALITGKKPSPAMVFGRFRSYAPQDLWSRKVEPAGEVVDVQVRELRELREVSDTPDNELASPTATPGAIRPAAVRGGATDVTDKNAARPADSAS